MALPAGATERANIGTAKTTVRSEAMIEEAGLLFKLRGGGTPPSLSQGGYNKGGVSASKGTHDKDAADWKTRLMSSTRRKLWQSCIWEVGYAAWIRTFLAGVWPAHTHGVPKDGDLAPLAEDQVTDFHKGLNGLKSHKPYPGILSSGFARRTWETYLKTRPSGVVDLSGLRLAFATGKAADPAQDAGDNDVQQVQRALNHFTGSKLSTDGIPGPATRGVYSTFQQRLYGVKAGSPAADGIPGNASLRTLGFTVTD